MPKTYIVELVSGENVGISITPVVASLKLRVFHDGKLISVITWTDDGWQAIESLSALSCSDSPEGYDSHLTFAIALWSAVRAAFDANGELEDYTGLFDAGDIELTF